MRLATKQGGETMTTTPEQYNRVGEIMLEKGMTQSALAAAAGITQPLVSRIASGQYQARVTTLRKIADALGVPLGELFI